MTLNAVTVFQVIGGVLDRWQRTTTTTLTVPGAASAVTGSSSTATSAQLSWGPPANTGGSPITGYTVSRTGGTPVTLAATARSYSFGGLTAATSYTLSVAAVNAQGPGPASTRPVTTQPVTVTGARFPGDPRPLLNNGRLFHGLSSDDAAGFTSLAQFETAIGKPVGIHHYFDNGVGIPSIAVPDATHPTRLGSIPARAKIDLAVGRLPLGSTHVNAGNWQAAGNGTFDATGKWIPDPAGGIYDDLIYAFVDWCEGSTSGTPNLSGPLFWIVNHEPENEGGNSVYFQSWMNRIRWVLNKWERDNAKKRQRLTFVTCNMAFTFKASATLGGTSPWWPGDGVPDIAGVDTYAEHSKDPALIKSTDTVLSSVFRNFVARCEHAGMPWGICEFGVLPQNSAGAQVIKDVYTYATDGTRDCIFLSYFNSGWWHLTDDNGTLSEAKTEAKKTTSIHLSDLGY